MHQIKNVLRLRPGEIIALCSSENEQEAQCKIVSYEGKKVLCEVQSVTQNTKEFDIPQRGEIITYVYSFPEPEEYTKMEIYPVLKSGRVCEKSDEINIVGCAGEVDLS